MPRCLTRLTLGCLLSAAAGTGLAQAPAASPDAAPTDLLDSIPAFGEVAVADADATTLDLEACVAYALDHSPTLDAERLATDLARLNNSIARSAWLPSLSANVDARHNFRLPVSIVPDFQNPESGETQAVTFGAVNTTTASLIAEQLLYSPAALQALRVRDPLVQSAALAVETVVQDLTADVSAAFFEVIRAREALRLAESDIARLAESLGNATARFGAGVDSRVPTLRAEILLNEARGRAAAARESIETRRAELARLIGFDAAEGLRLAYAYDALAEEATRTDIPELRADRRPEVRRLQTERDVQTVRIGAARTSWLPTVALQAAYDLNWQDNRIEDLFGRTFRSYYGALSVRTPLFRGGARRHETQLERVRFDQLGYTLAATLDRAGAEYRAARNQLQAALAALAVARENTALAEQLYELVHLQYAEGVATFLEVAIAENDLTSARIQSLNAIIDAATTRVRLRRASGTL